MQYLSKAYNYYSGINPATLSGAIDVIVVRQTDKDGNITLASTPFHVRFGKLQVLRAAEKRVTVKLPNNLPAPHIAPFAMKVGESGEAFFVLETTDQIPDDLLTSPVVMASDSDPSEDYSSTAVTDATVGKSLTKEPFGSTEKQVPHEKHLSDVDYLDLNKHATNDPLHDGRLPPNPLASPGAETQLPQRDHKLSEYNTSGTASSSRRRDSAADQGLPKVRPGDGEGPTIFYGSDVVLDVAGYHNQLPDSQDASVASPTTTQASRTEAFTRDLVSAAHHARPTLPHNSLTDPDIPIVHTPLDLDESSFDLSETTSRFDRGRSEPPPDFLPERSGRDSLSSSPNAAMDHAWDWGRYPRLNSELERDEVLDGLPPMRADGVSSTLDLASSSPGDLIGHVDQNPYLFTLSGSSGQTHAFELSLCNQIEGRDLTSFDETTFLKARMTYQTFMQDPDIVDDPRLVVRYDFTYHSRSSDTELLKALSAFRHSMNLPGKSPERPTSGSGWAWWRRKGQPADVKHEGTHSHPVPPSLHQTNSAPSPPVPSSLPEPASPDITNEITQYAKTLRLSSDQLKLLNLSPGPNTIQFSVTSSYSGMATCSARIFLWEDTDQVVISDIDGTITKSDALGHVFAAIGRDWTHLGIAKLYTDIGNNGYKMMYLTSRAIGQADSTREYLKSIIQGDYRLPEGPVIMSPDRLMASLHREVIMRKPELFKMACLRDIQRLFGMKANEAFFAGFGNRITDAMSYRSVGVPTSKIYTIDSTGVVKTELLQGVGHKASYVSLNDLVNEVFPPVKSKVKPEFTDFNYWRSDIASIPLPDLSPPSPALSARSDTSRYSVLGKIIGRRSSKQPILPTSEPSSRPSSPLISPALTDDPEEHEDDRSAISSMPGSFEEPAGRYMPRRDVFDQVERGEEHENEDDEGDDRDTHDDSYDDDAIFDDDILAAGEMKNVPF